MKNDVTIEVIVSIIIIETIGLKCLIKTGVSNMRKQPTKIEHKRYDFKEINEFIGQLIRVFKNDSEHHQSDIHY